MSATKARQQWIDSFLPEARGILAGDNPTEAAVRDLAQTLADEAENREITEHEERLADEAREEEDATLQAEWQAESKRIKTVERQVWDAAEKHGWSIEDRHESQSSHSLYITLAHPGHRYELKVRISDHRVPGGSGWCQETNDIHEEPDVNIIINEAGEFNDKPFLETLRCEN